MLLKVFYVENIWCLYNAVICCH